MQYSIISSIFILTIFLFFFLHIGIKDNKQSTLENRALTQRPDLTLESYLSGNYSKRFDQYYSDQFPFRDVLIETKAKIDSSILQRKIIEDVYISSDGYLLSQVAEQTNTSAKQIAENINQFAKEMKDLNVTTYTALMPNKSTMMEEKFPRYFPSYGQKNLDMLYEYLDELTNPIDSRDILEKHLNEENMFFYTDHHWQSKAAFYAYQNVMSTIIKNENMNEQIYEFDDYIWELKGKAFYGSDARKTTAANVKITDKILVAQPKNDYYKYKVTWGKRSSENLYNSTFLELDDPYTNRYQAYMGGDYANLIVKNLKKENDLNTLVIKDSYANAFIQFLVPHYSETHVMDLRHYKGMPISEYVKKYNIDHIILLNNVNSIYVTPSLTNFNNPGQGENQ